MNNINPVLTFSKNWFLLPGLISKKVKVVKKLRVENSIGTQ